MKHSKDPCLSLVLYQREAEWKQETNSLANGFPTHPPTLTNVAKDWGKRKGMTPTSYYRSSLTFPSRTNIVFESFLSAHLRLRQVGEI